MTECRIPRHYESSCEESDSEPKRPRSSAKDVAGHKVSTKQTHALPAAPEPPRLPLRNLQMNVLKNKFDTGAVGCSKGPVLLQRGVAVPASSDSMKTFGLAATMPVSDARCVDRHHDQPCEIECEASTSVTTAMANSLAEKVSVQGSRSEIDERPVIAEEVDNTMNSNASRSNEEIEQGSGDDNTDGISSDNELTAEVPGYLTRTMSDTALKESFGNVSVSCNVWSGQETIEHVITPTTSLRGRQTVAFANGSCDRAASNLDRALNRATPDAKGRAKAGMNNRSVVVGEQITTTPRTSAPGRVCAAAAGTIGMVSCAYLLILKK